MAGYATICPFCRGNDTHLVGVAAPGEAAFLGFTVRGEGRCVVCVVCKGCKAQGPILVIGVDGDDLECRTKAVEMWNKWTMQYGKSIEIGI
jgi:hypothetical protein